MSAMSWEASYEGSAASDGSTPSLRRAVLAWPDISLPEFSLPDGLVAKAAPVTCCVPWASDAEASVGWQAGARLVAFAVPRASDPDWRPCCCGNDAPAARPRFALVGRWPLLAAAPPPPAAFAASPLCRCCREVCRSTSRAARSSEGSAGRASREGGRLRSVDEALELGALPRAEPALDETRLPAAEEACDHARALATAASAVREPRLRSTEPAREAAVELDTDEARDEEREPPAAPARAVVGRVRSADEAREAGRLPAFDAGRLPALDAGRLPALDAGRLPALDAGREGSRGPAPAAAARRCTTLSSASSWRARVRARSSSFLARLSSVLSRITWSGSGVGVGVGVGVGLVLGSGLGLGSCRITCRAAAGRM